MFMKKIKYLLNILLILLFSCSSDFKGGGGEEFLRKHSLPLCLYNDICMPLEAEKCRNFGFVVTNEALQCPQDNSSSGGSSSSQTTLLSSSSSLQSSHVSCQIDNACVSMDSGTCLAFGGSIVGSCAGVSSSGSRSSSSGLSYAVTSGSWDFGSNMFTDSRDNKSYPFTVIGSRVWMTENLNYSAGETLGWCYYANMSGANPHENSSYCNDGYGRVYNFSESDLCPTGWHIPNASEWTSVSSSIKRILAGNYDPTNSWKERGTYGFYWVGNGQLVIMSSDYFEIQTPTKTVEYFSIRCVANETQSCGIGTFNPATQFCIGSTIYSRCGTASYNPATDFCSGTTIYKKCGNQEYNTSKQKCEDGVLVDIYGTFTDTRDGKIYETINIGSKTWMTENLNYSAGETLGWCYGANMSGANPHENSSYCDDGYGRVYNFSESGLCPAGWRIPSESEWTSAISSINRILAGNYDPTNLWKERGTYGFYWVSDGRLIIMNSSLYEIQIPTKTVEYFSVRCVK
jgi:uncharacterized protein (TIGR02145 family)